MFTPREYAQLAASLPGDETPLTAPNSQVAPFAHLFLQYASTTESSAYTTIYNIASTGLGQEIPPGFDNSETYQIDHIVTEVVAGMGAGGGPYNVEDTTQGQGTFTFTYTANTNAQAINDQGFNTWSYKTGESLPDGSHETIYMNFTGQTMLSDEFDSSGVERVTYYRFDTEGHTIMVASPSAFLAGGGYYNDSNWDLLGFVGGVSPYLNDYSGLISDSVYYPNTTANATTPGGIAGLAESQEIQQGQLGLPIVQERTSYYMETWVGGPNGANSTIYPIAQDSVFQNVGQAETTTYTYTFFAVDDHASNQIRSTEVSLPLVATSENGSGLPDVSWMFYDIYGNLIWTKDGNGNIDYSAYDAGTGALLESIDDVNTVDTSDFSNLPSGWTTPSGGGLNLVTTYQVDDLGRTTLEQDPNYNFTITRYDDNDHQVLTFTGWLGSGTASPIKLVRIAYPAANSDEPLFTEHMTIAYGALSSFDAYGVGTPPASAIQTLSRDILNQSGQLVETDRYLSMAGYSPSNAQFGSSGTGYYATIYGYDPGGRQDHVQGPTGTITDTAFNSYNQPLTVSIGTNDATANNMVVVEADQYDDGGTGDWNLTQTIDYPGGGQPNRVTNYVYDWQDRLVATRVGDPTDTTGANCQITYFVLDNLDDVVEQDTYNGDGLTITSFDGVPVQPPAADLTSQSINSYDTDGRLYRTQTFDVNSSPAGTATITGLSNGTPYYFDVTALDGSTESGPSNQSEATPTANTLVPVLSEPVPGNGQVSLSWTDVSGATGYVVTDSWNGGANSSSNTIGNVTNYTVTPLSAQTVYTFSVAAIVGGTTGPSSNTQRSTAQNSSVLDGNFQEVNVNGGYEVDPTGSPWTFSGGSGIESPSAFNYPGEWLAAGRDDNAQAGFLITGSFFPAGVSYPSTGSSISQALMLAAGTYTLTFDAGAEYTPVGGWPPATPPGTYYTPYPGDSDTNVAFGQAGEMAQPFTVELDNNAIMTVTPIRKGPSDPIFSEYTATITVTSGGSHTLAFQSVSNPYWLQRISFITNVALTPASSSPSVGDPAFMGVNVGTGSGAYEYDPTGDASWTFSGNSGIEASGSILSDPNVNVPVGPQAGFVETGVGNTAEPGEISQEISLPQGNYTLSFFAAGGQPGNLAPATIDAQIDGHSILSATPPISTTPSSNGSSMGDFTQYIVNFTVASSGNHTLSFAAENDTSDQVALINDVQIRSAAPTNVPPTLESAAEGNEQVTLNWSAVNGATAYKVYWGTSPNSLTNWQLVASDALTTNVFYDNNGNVIETAAPSGLATKTTYDGVNWPTFVYYTDGSTLNDPSAVMTWAAAGSVANDVVLNQTQYIYDGDGNVIETINSDRDSTDGNTATGPLVQGSAAVNMSTITLSAAQSPTGSALTLTWVPDVSGSAEQNLGVGYASDPIADINWQNDGIGSIPSGETAVWIIPPSTAGVYGGVYSNLTGSQWAFSVQDSSGDFLEGQYGTVSGEPLVLTAANNIQSAGISDTDSDPTFYWPQIQTVNDTPSTPAARVSYTASYYDEANRDIADVDLGTNGGQPWTQTTARTATGGTNGTLVDTSLAGNDGDYFGDVLRIIGGTGAGQLAVVTGYSASTHTLTLNAPLLIAPTSGSLYLLLPPAPRTATGGSTNSVIDSSLTGGNNAYDGYTMAIIDGPGAGQTATVTGYNSSTYTLTLGSTLSTAAASGSVYLLFPADNGKITGHGYNTAGWQATVTDPRGIVTERLYDALGRTTETIKAYTNGTPTADTNQITQYTYDGDNDVLTMTATDFVPGTNGGSASTVFQTTTYIYDASTSTGSDINSNDLLTQVQYPDPSGGSNTAADDVTYTYDALGDQLTMVDRNGTTHSYAYDVLGRMTSDSMAVASGNPENVDTSVTKLGYSFNSQGLPFEQTSYNSSGGVVNQVEDLYNGLGQLTGQYQADAGSVNSSTAEVQYDYSSPSTGSRETEMIYPNGRILNFGYNDNTLDNAVGRVDYLADGGGSGAGTQLEVYQYLGLDTIVSMDRGNGVDLNYGEQLGQTSTASASGSAVVPGGDQYTGLDQFGQVIDQNWINSSTATSVDRFQYGYDADGNVLYKNNIVHPFLSELYHANSATSSDNATAYDPLNRLASFMRGTLSASGHNGTGALDQITASGAPSLSYTLDAQGNVVQVASGGTITIHGFTDNNEESSSGSTATLSYDQNGNTLNDAGGTTYHYDAWNRLVGVTEPGSLQKQVYGYNALGEQVVQSQQLISSVPAALLINDGSAQRAMIESLTVVFNAPVTLSSGAISLTGASGVSISWTNPSGDGRTWLISFSGSGISYGSLPDGAYTLTVTGSDVTYTAGGTMSSNPTFTFWRLYGDFYGDGAVSGEDFALVGTWFNHILPRSLWYLAYDDGGVDNGASFAAVALRFNELTTGTQSGNLLSSFEPTRDLYYSSLGQVVQENVLSTSSSGTVADQYVWGLAYVNDLVLRDASDGNWSRINWGTSTSGLDERMYAEQDADWNVTSLTDTSGNVAERFVYTPYGAVTVLNAGGYQIADGYGWNYLYQGMREDLATGMYVTLNRIYDPATDRWMQEDSTYVNGANLYQFLGDNPINRLDPMGTHWDEGWDGAFAAFFGNADSDTQAAYDQSIWDRSNGTLDVVSPVPASTNGLFKKADTFDPSNRRGAATFAKGDMAAINLARGNYKGALGNVASLMSGLDQATKDRGRTERAAIINGPFPDPAQPEWDNGQVVVDHVRARALGGSDDDANKQLLPAETNARKGGYERDISQDRQDYIDQGLDPTQADQVLDPEISSLGTSPPPRPMDTSEMDNSFTWETGIESVDE